MLSHELTKRCPCYCVRFQHRSSGTMTLYALNSVHSAHSNIFELQQVRQQLATRA